MHGSVNAATDRGIANPEQGERIFFAISLTQGWLTSCCCKCWKINFSLVHRYRQDLIKQLIYGSSAGLNNDMVEGSEFLHGGVLVGKVRSQFVIAALDCCKASVGQDPNAVFGKVAQMDSMLGYTNFFGNASIGRDNFYSGTLSRDKFSCRWARLSAIFILDQEIAT